VISLNSVTLLALLMEEVSVCCKVGTELLKLLG